MRLMTGSYVRLREAEAREREAAQQKLLEEVGDEYLPDDLKGLDLFEEGEEP